MKPDHTVGPRDLFLLIQEIPQVLHDNFLIFFSTARIAFDQWF